MKQKLVLIIPPSPWLISDTDIPMMGILYISSYTKNLGYEVEVCDLSGLPKEKWKIPKGTIYGVTGTSPQFIHIKEIIEVIKTRQPEAIVVVGGTHASICPEHIMSNTRADICVIGEGEMVMAEIMEGRKDKFIKAKRINNLDILPFPDRDAIDYDKYLKVDTFKYLLGDSREVAIISSRGCPFTCSFCASPLLWKRIVRGHSIGYLKKELKFIKKKYNANLITFSDDTFTLNINRVNGIAKELSRLNLHWHCLARVDCPTKLYKTMEDNGCVQVTFGFESGSNRLLKFINKKATIENAYNAIKYAHKAGLKIRGQLIVGLPGETAESVEETANFINNADEVDKFGLHIFQPIPGCDIALNPEKYNYEIKNKQDFSDYHTIGKPGELPTKDEKVIEWYNYLRDIIGKRNIDRKEKA